MEQRPGGGVTAYTYDARARVRTISRGTAATDLREQIETSYDPGTGKKSLERILAFESGAWVEKKRESFTYDALAQLQTVTHADGASSGYTYEPDGKLAGVRDENHATPNTAYAYDPAGRLLEVRQVLGAGAVATRYSYDAHGNLTSVTDPNGNVTTYVFDDFGQMLTQQSPVSGTTAYVYDAAGQLLSTTDANGAATARTYDAIGRVLTSTSTRSGKATEIVTWGYDDATAGRHGIGRVATMNDPAGTTVYSYERRGLLRREERTFLGTTGASVTTFTWNADGERSSLGYPSGLRVDYTHDYAGRPLSWV
jgi:YD repeat-containing protein